MHLSLSFKEIVMLNIHMLVSALELRVEMQDLIELGLSEEEVEGFIDMFCEELIVRAKDKEMVLN